jgi:hypothetical protein
MAQDFLTGPIGGDLPNFDQYLRPAPVPVATVSATPPATGAGNWLTAGLGSGYYGALSQLGSAGEALGQAVGAPGFAQSAADWAARQRATAQTYARPDLEQAPWYSPTRLGYQLAQSAPAMAGIVGAGLLGAATAPEAAVGGGAAAAAAAARVAAMRMGLGSMLGAYPLAVGENVQRAEDYGGPIDRGQALKAAAYGLPEAALQGILPGMAENFLTRGAAGKLIDLGFGRGTVEQVVGSRLGQIAGATGHNVLTGALRGAGIQAGVGAATEALTQQMGDPDRTLAERAHDVVSAALGGAMMGGAFGGALSGVGRLRAELSPIAKIDPARLQTQVLDKATAGLDPNIPPPAPPTTAPPPLPTEPPGEPWATPATFGKGPMLRLPPPSIPQGAARPDIYAMPVADLVSLGAFAKQHGDQDLLHQVAQEILRRTGRVVSPEETGPAPAAAPPEAPPAPEAPPTPVSPEAPPAPEAAPFDNDGAFKLMRKVGGGIPRDLQDQTFQSQEELNQAIAKLIAERTKPDGTAPGMRSPLMKIAKRFSIVDDEGSFTEKYAGVVPKAASVETMPDIGPAPESPPIVRPDRSTMPNEIHAALWDQLEGLRDQLDQSISGDDPDLHSLHDVITKAQIGLRDVVGGQAQAKMQTVAKNVIGLIPKAIADKQIAASAAQAKVALDVPSPAARDVVAGLPPQAPTDMEALKSAVTDTTQKLNALKGVKLASGSQDVFERGLADQRAKLKQIARMVNDGDVAGLQNVSNDHFGNGFWNWFRERLSDPTSNQALNDHADSEEQLIDAINRFKGQDASWRASDNGPISQSDVDAMHVINNSQRARDVFGYYANNGTDQEKFLANVLLRTGVDPTIKFRSVKGTPLTGNVDQLTKTAGSYSQPLNRISIYDRSDMGHTVLHEGVHAAVNAALDQGGEAAQELQRLFDAYRDHVVKSGGNPGNTYGLTNVREFVAEALSNERFKNELRQHPLIGAIGSIWDGFKRVVAKLLGLAPGQEQPLNNLLDQVHLAAHQAMADQMTMEGRALPGESALRAQPGETALNAHVRMGLEDASRGADAIRERSEDALAQEAVGWAKGVASNIVPRMRGMIYGFTPDDTIAQLHARDLPSAKSFVQLKKDSITRGDVLTQHRMVAKHMFDALPKKAQGTVQRLMTATALNLDPRKSWAEHTWLLNQPNALRLKAEYENFHQLWRGLGGVEGGQLAYEALRASGAADLHANLAHRMYDYAVSRGIDVGADPFKVYDNQFAMHGDPLRAEQYWRGASGDLFDKLTKQRDQFLAETQTNASQRQALVKLKKAAQRAGQKDIAAQYQEQITKLDQKNAAPLRNFADTKKMVGDVGDAIQRGDQGVYFHLGRDGDFYVAGHINLDENGQIRDQDVTAIQRRLQAENIRGPVLMHGTNQNSFYVRVGSISEMNHMYVVLSDLQKQGVFDKAEPLSKGQAHQEAIYKMIAPARMHEALAALEAEKPDYPPDASETTKRAIDVAFREQLQDVRRSYMNLLPENSIAKLYTHRLDVQGFDENMMKGFESAGETNARGLSRLSYGREMGQLKVALRDEVTAANRDSKVDPSRAVAISQAANELILRENQRMNIMPDSPFDVLRKMTHVIHVGMSPAYVFTMASQLGTLSLPELGAVHGFTRAGLALAKAAPEAFKVMRAVSRGPAGLTFGLNYDALRQAGFSDARANFWMRHAKDMNQGAWTEAMAGHGSDSFLGNKFKWANAMGRYSEMLPRLVTAAAADDLYRAKPVKGFESSDAYVSHAVGQSQFDFSSATTPRQLGRGGMLGPMTPLVNQFMRFTTNLTAKLYTETHAMLSAELPAEERLRAAKWLVGHSAAMTMVAGTLGLPMVTVAASVFDKVADTLLGKDNIDIQAAYRNWLADAFGKDAGEVIARGLPRAFGADFDHLGEGKIAPGSTFLMMITEKRKLEDAERDWAKSMTGSAAGTVMNLFSAARDMLNGDYLDGAVKTVPELLKSPLEATRLGWRGFVDKKGTPLPITASAKDVALTALGIDPGKEAEYQETKKVQLGEQTLRTLREQNIIRHLVMAENRHDPVMFQQWAAQSDQFARDHPGMLPPLADFGRSYGQQLQAAAIARGMGMPLGTNLRDIVGRRMLRFGNLEQQP